MKIQNFFDEDMELDSDASEIKKEIAKAYGIPIENQSIHNHNGATTLFLVNNVANVTYSPQHPIPESVHELGCTQEMYNQYYGMYGDAYMKQLFPFLGLDAGRASSAIEYQFSTGADTLNALIESIPPKQKNLILHNVVDYIDKFITSTTPNLE